MNPNFDSTSIKHDRLPRSSPQVSPDLITQHATGSSERSTYTVLAWAWGLFTVKHRMPTSNTNTQQSEFGPADDTGRAFSSTDITESLASPSSRSQRLRPALGNQRTQTCTFKMKLLHLVLKKDTDRHPVTGNIDVHGLNNTCTVQAQDSRVTL